MPALDLAEVDAFAARLHEGQTRRQGTPYIAHPRAVRVLAEDLAAALGLALDDVTRAACLLHDVVEDCDVDEAELSRRFGPEVAARVGLLSKPEELPGEDRVARNQRYFDRLVREADDVLRVVKVADRLHNLAELHLAPDRERLGRYLEETRRFLLPLVRGAASPTVARGLEATLEDGIALAARLQGLSAPEQKARDTRVPRGLYAILDVTPASDLDALRSLAAAAIEGGAALVQVRCKGVTDRAALGAVEELLPVARRAGVPLVVNDRADLARVSGSDGVHVGQTDLPPPRLRPLLDEGMLLGASSHTREQAQRVEREGGVDYVAFGPVHASPTKQGHADVTGLASLEEVARSVSLPLCAIGGLTTPERMAGVARAGAQLGAVISALSGAPDPRFMARRLALAHAAAFEREPA